MRSRRAPPRRGPRPAPPWVGSAASPGPASGRRDRSPVVRPKSSSGTIPRATTAWARARAWPGATRISPASAGSSAASRIAPACQRSGSSVSRADASALASRASARTRSLTRRSPGHAARHPPPRSPRPPPTARRATAQDQPGGPARLTVLSMSTGRAPYPTPRPPGWWPRSVSECWTWVRAPAASPSCCTVPGTRSSASTGPWTGWPGCRSARHPAARRRPGRVAALPVLPLRRRHCGGHATPVRPRSGADRDRPGAPPGRPARRGVQHPGRHRPVGSPAERHPAAG